MVRWIIGAVALFCTACTIGVRPDPYEPREPPPFEPPIEPAAPSVEPRAAISGGTMTILPNGLLAVVDPQAGLLALVDPETAEVTASFTLTPQDEPGRVIGDPSGRVHLVLRNAGDLLTFDASLVARHRREVCAAPRGLVYDAEGDLVHVACASGELVSLPAAGGEPTRIVTIEPDLNDVVITDDGQLYASVFRSAELLTIDADGAIVERRRPAPTERFEMSEIPVVMEPNVAWRIRAMPGGRVVMAHQRSAASPLDVEVNGYGGGECRTGVVESTVSIFDPSTTPAPLSALAFTVLPVDVSYFDEALLVVQGANESHGFGGSFGAGPRRVAISGLTEPCAFPELTDEPLSDPNVSATAVEVLADGTVATQYVGSTVLVLLRPTAGPLRRVAHPAPHGNSPGFALFHSSTPSGVACASCHPAGGEDGHTWEFVGIGRRRTQTLLGGLLETAPFHWSGDQPTMASIMDGAFVNRMGAFLVENDVESIEQYLDALPIPEGIVEDEAAWGRGSIVFARECSSCHSGAAMTNNESLDIGTGGAFQVPGLRGVAYRAPFFHDGCAASLSDVLDGACGTATTHGAVAALTADDRSDLHEYLRSL